LEQALKDKDLSLAKQEANTKAFERLADETRRLNAKLESQENRAKR
jgi:hypothetical protein